MQIPLIEVINQATINIPTTLSFPPIHLNVSLHTSFIYLNVDASSTSFIIDSLAKRNNENSYKEKCLHLMMKSITLHNNNCGAVNSEHGAVALQ